MARGFERSQGNWIIVLTFFVAFILSILSLPDFFPNFLGYLRPDWILMILIYWVITLPQQIGLMIAWVCGFIVDVMLGGLLGQHSLSFMLVTYIVVNQYQRVRMFTIWQQSLVIFFLILINQLLNLWIDATVKNSQFSAWYFMPTLATSLLWPFSYAFLRGISRRFGAS